MLTALQVASTVCTPYTCCHWCKLHVPLPDRMLSMPMSQMHPHLHASSMPPALHTTAPFLFLIPGLVCRFLWFPPEQHPIVCQLGGSNPQTLAAAAKIVAKYGYDEINLNCGCPSERVAGAGCFGAAMMLQPKLVADCCQAMQEAVPHIPVTVKCRLGELPILMTWQSSCTVQVNCGKQVSQVMQCTCSVSQNGCAQWSAVAQHR